MSLEYTDLLSSFISNLIRGKITTPAGLSFFGAKTKLDLHPEDGYMLSTKKFITCRDNRGNKYKITLEANPAASMDEELERLNKIHCANGDPLNHYLDSITTKLQFAQQDRTVLAEISPAELEVLQIEVNAAIEAKESDNGSF